jgi:DNA-binding transcriptional MocR family regulator
MQLQLERGSERPLHRQIESQIRSLIEAGDLAVGSRLPASRHLARSLSVNRATVTTAYEALAAAGYVEATVGRGTEVVRNSVAPPAPVRQGPSPRLDWTSLLSTALEAHPPVLDRPAGPVHRAGGRLDFTALVPDENLFPVQRLRRCIDDVLRARGGELLQYGSPSGWEPFREVLAHRMRMLGIHVAAEDVLIVNGAQQGLDLFCKALLDPGDVVAVESPTYGNLLPVLRLHRAEVVPIPMTAQGLDLERLEAVLNSRRVKFLYTMPHFQNPTGITSALPHRKALLDVAVRHGLTILEDGYEEELRWDGGEVLPLRALDTSGRVCYVGTFSKGLCPGFRIGWLVAHRDLLAHLAYLKRATDYHTSLVLQAALAEFCKRGDYDAHLRRLRRIYRGRMVAAAAAFEKHMPERVRWRVPQGGYCLWVELPAGVSEDELVARLARDGVHVSPGRHFFATDPGYGCFRMSISRVNVEQIEAGIAIAGRHLAELVGQASGGEARAALPYI